MSILPVILRELKSQARQPLTYWLRVLGAISVAGAFGIAWWNVHDFQNSNPFGSVRNPVGTFGTALFGKLNLFMFLSIWLFVPLSTADAISRERREGTLALLFLTELRSWGIVLGKASAHVLRAFSLFLTMAPWLLIPVLFGGVGLRDIFLAMMLNSSALLLALAAGLLASTIPRDWLKAVILSELFALCLLLMMLNFHAAVLKQAIHAGDPASAQNTRGFTGPSWIVQDLVRPSDGVLRQTIRQIEFTTSSSLLLSQRWFRNPYSQPSLETQWETMWENLPQKGQRAWFLGVIRMVAWSAGTLLAALWIGAWCVRRFWQDAPRSESIQELERALWVPRFRLKSLSRTMSRSLTANPVGWLQHYSPKARMVKWAWCLFILLAEILLSSSATDLYDAQAGLGLILLAGLGFSATGSFRNEFETGAFELLLVTPLRERQIIWGRVRGLWNQFLPAMAIYGAGSIYLTSGWNTAGYAREAWLALLASVVSFCVLPVVGLYFSVRRLNLFVAWAFACSIGLLPGQLARMFGAELTVVIPFQLIVGIATGLMLETRMRSRHFVARAN